jgi:hypothetical protein
MKTVSVSDFRDHGQMLGICLPVKRDQARVERALDRLDETVNAISKRPE